MVLGRFSDGETSTLVDARLDVVDHCIVLRDKDNLVLYQCPRAQVVISSRLGNTPRRITFKQNSDRQSFETDDNDGIDELFLDETQSTAWLHRLETNRSLVAGASLFAIAFVFWLIVYALPQGAAALAFTLPQEVIDQTGKSTLDALDRAYFDPSELSTEERDRVFAALAPHVLTASTSLHFRKGPPNAFALADGSIVFTDGLIQLAENNQELIAIAYHELGHVQNRHLIRRAIQGSAITVMLFLLTGDVSDIDILVTVPSMLADLSFSRAFETEADQFALETLTAEGIDPIHFYRILEKLNAYYLPELSDQDQDSGVLSYLSTHPETTARLQQIAAYRQEHWLSAVPANSDDTAGLELRILGRAD